MATEDRRLLERAAQRAEERPAFIAFALAEYRRLNNLMPDALAQHLQGDALAITRLALCLRPESSDPKFIDEVNQIAAHVGVNALRLLTLLREVDAQAALQGAGADARLMAARQKPANASADSDDDAEVSNDGVAESSDD